MNDMIKKVIKKENNRKWREKNPEYDKNLTNKQKERKRKKYWEKNKEKINKRRREIYWKDPELARKKWREWSKAYDLKYA